MTDLAGLISDLKIRSNIPNPSQQFKNTVDGLANIYTFDIKPTTNGKRTMVYRYDVELVELNRNKSLTTGASDDGKRGLMQDICFELVTTAFKSTDGFQSGNQAEFVYDNRKILFTNYQVQPLLLEISPNLMSDFTQKFLRTAVVRFELKPCKEKSHEMDLNNLLPALCPSPYEQSDHSLRQFLEMLTSQSFINAKSHKIIGLGRVFERKEHRRLNPTITTYKGLAKGVRIIANGGTKPTAALVADVKTCAFFMDGNLEQIANLMMKTKKFIDSSFWEEFGQLYKGVSAYLTYAPSRVIVIDTITSRNCSDIKIDADGREMSIVEFFRVKKNTEIRGDFPAARQQNERNSLFPLSCLQVLPYQRFPLEKTLINYETSQISDKLLRENTVKPDVRYAAINEQVCSIGKQETMSAKFMLKFGVKVKGGRNDVTIGMRQLPKVKFDGQEIAERGRQFDFGPRGQWKYLEPSKILKSWIVGYTHKVNNQDIKNFMIKLLSEARRRGMVLTEPIYETIEQDVIDRDMERMKNTKVQFLFYIDNKFTKSHSKLKLCEIKYGIITQHVTIENVQKAGFATILNILNKLNMKLSGLNYLPIPENIAQNKFNLASGNLLVIGIDTSKPPRATAFEKAQLRKHGMEGFVSEDPMVVGICANFVARPEKFCGDYFFQPCKQDVVEESLIYQKIHWVLNQVKVNRKKAPQVIFVIRDGISEGMVPNAVKGEFNVIMEACKKFSPNWSPKFVFCVVDKRHNKRFFVNGQQQKVENTLPGSVIDRKFVRVDLHEFFMQAHYPLNGVPVIPQFMIPINQVNANNDELQSFLLSLCNMWQIVMLAPALPGPVLQAKELAKRGRNNYVELKRNTPQQVPRVAGKQMIDFERLNAMMSYAKNSFLLGTRFNA